LTVAEQWKRNGPKVGLHLNIARHRTLCCDARNDAAGPHLDVENLKVRDENGRQLLQKQVLERHKLVFLDRAAKVFVKVGLEHDVQILQQRDVAERQRLAHTVC
jgi:hypothetical protein